MMHVGGVEGWRIQDCAVGLWSKYVVIGVGGRKEDWDANGGTNYIQSNSSSKIVPFRLRRGVWAVRALRGEG
jgi:hypothetical protein